MNRFYFACTAAMSALCLSSSAFAADLSQPVTGSPWDAYVSVGAGFSSFDNVLFPEDEADGFAGEIRSTAAYRFTNGFGIQSDVVFNYQDLDIDLPGDFSTESTDVAGHAFYRDENFLLGAFGQFGVTDYGSLDVEIDRFYAGGEAQAFWGAFTLYAQGGWQGQDWGDDLDDDAEVDGFFISAEGRYFATDNLKFSLRGGYDTVDVAGFFDMDTVHVGGGVEYRLDASPLSAFLNVDFSQTEVDEYDLETNEVRVLAGIKLNLGTDTLIQRDRSGASLDPVKPLAFGYVSPF